MDLQREDNIFEREDSIKIKKSAAIRGKANRLYLFFLIALGAFITIIYINNVISVNNLLDDKQSLIKEYKTLQNTNKMLNSKFIELQSSEEIIRFAIDSLGLIKSEEIPRILR